MYIVVITELKGSYYDVLDYKTNYGINTVYKPLDLVVINKLFD